MKADIQQIKRDLKRHAFLNIFKEELGWSPLREVSPAHQLKGLEYTSTSLAQKEGFKIYLYTFQTRVPNEQTLKQIDKLLNSDAEEHLTIFADVRQENQAWLWVKRRENQPPAAHLNRLNKNQSGDLLAQKVARLYVSIDDEEFITLTSILDRVNLAFDVEKVTTKFYKEFQAKHDYFLEHIENMDDEDDRKWYTSIMLNRLMFVYFLQRKGLLNNSSSILLKGDDEYLQNRLKAVQKEHGSGKFYEFYCYFLQHLFHKGLNQPERSPELEKIIGKVPYINGGLFDVHALEKQYPQIQIKDEVFGKIFEFFEKFTWHLDDRPMRDDKEINPDVLGYIFEKYINQKQMGAYYTKEDITGYISKNTIIPFLFTKVAEQFPDEFLADGSIWSLLKTQPNEYIYEEIAHGRLEPLPPEIEVGKTDIAQRSAWNKPADEQYALPTETWREVVERHHRYDEVYNLLVTGKISTINDLITYNLNITQFASDAIAKCNKPALLYAFYNAIEHVTVLDPTCGSGAFLFAALNILKPLYQVCITCMQEHNQQQTRLHVTQRKSHSFQHILDRIEGHRSQEYFILKSIIINNLYGVDIMEEATEICKLRLFLKLVAQIQKPDDLEPLPDIDFNVLAGNTLIGFTNMDEIRRITEKLFNVGDTEATLAQIELNIKDIERDERAFRNLQTVLKEDEDSSAAFAVKKLLLREKLRNLREKLDPFLATEYRITEEKYQEIYASEYQQWHKSHKPFHWWTEFHEIIDNGGFNVIIGNPPYVEISDVKDQYSILNMNLISTGNLYSICFERFLSLLSTQGRIGVIMPISSISTPRMLPLMRFIANNLIPYISNFAVRPGKLFVGVDMNLTILVGSRKQAQETQKAFSTNYMRWQEANRDDLFHTLSYCSSQLISAISAYPKIGTQREAQLKDKIDKYTSITRFQASYNTSPVYYHSGGRYFRKCIRKKLSNEYKEIQFKTGMDSAAICVLSSSLYYWLWIAQSDCYHVTIRDIKMLPAPDSLLADLRLEELASRLLIDMEKNAEIRVRNRKDGSQREEVNYKMRRSKPIIDEIDRILAQHYGFTPEELDFIINYDIKYRMGRDNGNESEE